jgi:alkylation response protein AidB-like acyl-CoA dehydrogenase
MASIHKFQQIRTGTRLGVSQAIKRACADMALAAEAAWEQTLNVTDGVRAAAGLA